MNQKRTSIAVIGTFIFVAAASRLVPHPPNFTPLGAMALFGTVTLASRWLAILLPFIALYISDLVINNVLYAEYHESFTWGFSTSTYLGFLAVIGLGLFALRGKGFNASRIAGVTIVGTVVFYLITNFFSWYVDPFNMYADNAAGLLASYTAAIPFFLNSLMGDCFFTFVLFGGYAFYQSRQGAVA
ncbi:MAG: DUF6580 family putative transport protein [Bacteroidota bacterium]